MQKFLIPLFIGLLAMISVPATASAFSYQSVAPSGQVKTESISLDMSKVVGGVYTVINRLLWNIVIPLDGGIVTSHFGLRNGDHHDGIDFASRWGAWIYAAQDGVVTKAQVYNGYGNIVEINHGDGVYTRYGHLSSFSVRTGEVVSRGDIIGALGDTGNSAGPHLHFEIRINDIPKNPYNYLPIP